MEAKLPVHGFVLAGGKSTRMGVDKALLPFCGRPMVEIAVEKLRAFCATVSIAGNRDDLSEYAPVVHEARSEVGPAAGVEAGLLAAMQPWVLFVPVDVPLVPMELLRNWVETIIVADSDESVSGSYLLSEEQSQPAFCLLRQECMTSMSGALDKGERRLTWLLDEARVPGRDVVRAARAERCMGVGKLTSQQMEFWFSNVNTPQELIEAEAWALDRDGTLQSRVHHRRNHHE